MAIALERSDMKKFNRDYTTPEQSMRLLELGLQPNSANLFYSKFERETFGLPRLCYNKRYSDIVPYGYEEYYLPCWSVGRLMEIYDTYLPDNGDWPNYFKYGNLLEYVIDCIDVAIEKELIDFSKLEE